jgi:hypothetical protein
LLLRSGDGFGLVGDIDVDISFGTCTESDHPSDEHTEAAARSSRTPIPMLESAVAMTRRSIRAMRRSRRSTGRS